jgi:hypothetical protein
VLGKKAVLSHEDRDSRDFVRGMEDWSESSQVIPSWTFRRWWVFPSTEDYRRGQGLCWALLWLTSSLHPPASPPAA